MHALAYEFTSRKLCLWGGLKFFFSNNQKSGIREKLSRRPFPKHGSNRGYQPEDQIEAFMCSVVMGSRRLAQGRTLRSVEFVKEIFGWRRGVANQKSTRFLMMAYNLMAIFKRFVMRTAKGRVLSTIRFQLIATGSIRVKRGSQKVMMLSAEGRRRHFLAHFFENLETLHPPFEFPNAYSEFKPYQWKTC